MSYDFVPGLRRQYHFQPDDNGRKAWDVHRLIHLSRDLPIEQVPIASLAEIDSIYWFHEKDYPATVRAVIEHTRLILESDLTYPVILGADGRVMDGMHRVARALMDGHATLAARRFPIDPEPDHRNCSAGELDYSEPSASDQ